MLRRKASQVPSLLANSLRSCTRHCGRSLVEPIFWSKAVAKLYIIIRTAPEKFSESQIRLAARSRSINDVRLFTNIFQVWPRLYPIPPKVLEIRTASWIFGVLKLAQQFVQRSERESARYRAFHIHKAKALPNACQWICSEL